MAHDNFEKRIREQLEGRTIKPSDEAWNKLEHRLGKADGSKNKTSFWFLGIAASIVLGILFVFKDKTVNTPMPKINTVTTTDTVSIKQNINKNILKGNENATKATRVVAINPKQKLENPKKSKLKTVDLNKTHQVVYLKKRDTPVVINAKTAQITPKVVLSNNKLKPHSSEADNLLQRAQQQLTQENTKAPVQVSAEQLLLDVENTIELTFRQKVFKTVKQNFNKVKTAVAERNKH